VPASAALPGPAWRGDSGGSDCAAAEGGRSNQDRRAE